jgi:hypothetical protein
MSDIQSKPPLSRWLGKYMQDLKVGVKKPDKKSA